MATIVSIEDYPGYGACQEGLIYSFKRDKFLKLQINRTGYYVVNLYCKSKVNTKLVHRIIAKIFVSNPNKHEVVNHKNGIITDNNASNLEWTTIQGNCIHASENGLLKPHTRRVCQYDTKGMFIKEFPSIKQASLETNIISRNISKVCVGNRMSAGGFGWKYAENADKDIRKNAKCKPVSQYTIEGIFIAKYFSIQEASKKTGISRKRISDSCLNKEKSLVKYIWKYTKAEKPPELNTTNWKEIKGFEDYLVSEDGRIYNKLRKTLCTISTNFGGYKYVQLSGCNGRKRFRIHRLVALTYLENPNNLPLVNHLDNDPTNNHVSNLEWCTYSRNAQHGVDINPNRKAVPVFQYTKKGEFIKEYPSAKLAQETLGLGHNSIFRVCCGKGKTAGGYVWKYKDSA
jgi:hypothetical protein